MTATDLDALESLLAKATPGPWWYDFKGGSGAAIIRSDTVRTVLHCGTVYPQDARLIVAAVNALPSLIAYVRELERQRDAVAAAVADGLRALDADVIGTGPARKPKRDHGGSTHWDIAEAGAVCHDDCAIEQIKTAALAMRERCAQACEEAAQTRLSEGHDAPTMAAVCAAAIRALEP